MELLESYLKAVRRYLPRRQRDDIIAELSEELRSQMESRQAELRRPLRDEEQMAVLKAYGDPMNVARRYHQNRRSLTIGWELIGPELFPMYLIILGLNLTCALGCSIGLLLYLHQPIELGALFRIALIQVAIVTLTFTILNSVRRKCPQPWYYPPAELAPMIPVAPWYSISGLCVWGLFSSWWALVPFFPSLLLGSAAKSLDLAPAWHRFYLPVLALLVLGIAQRAVNLARPSWSGLLPASRLLVNAIALGLQYPMIKSYPYVLAAVGATDKVHVAQIAANFNGLILWGVLSWMWIYHLVSVVIYAWYCAPYVRRLFQRKQGRIRFTQEINGVL
jgi:hypothetical protein